MTRFLAVRPYWTVRTNPGATGGLQRTKATSHSDAKSAATCGMLETEPEPSRAKQQSPTHSYTESATVNRHLDGNIAALAAIQRKPHA